MYVFNGFYVPSCTFLRKCATQTGFRYEWHFLKNKDSTCNRFSVRAALFSRNVQPKLVFGMSYTVLKKCVTQTSFNMSCTFFEKYAN
jgi:hypothetical protein